MKIERKSLLWHVVNLWSAIFPQAGPFATLARLLEGPVCLHDILMLRVAADHLGSSSLFEF